MVNWFYKLKIKTTALTNFVVVWKAAGPMPVVSHGEQVEQWPLPHPATLTKINNYNQQ
jgi:hypothetical protein